MRKLSSYIILAAVIILVAETSYAYWIWTPETKKFINPKYAVKDSPKEQFEWAMGFYDSGDYQRAVAEFEKLVKHYEYSEYASKAQYYAGLSYENMGKYYIAFQNYQKAIENFPHIENVDEIIEREYNIANFYSEKAGPKLMGVDLITSLDRSIEIYKKVVDNAPYGKFADEALFKMGESLKRSERYDEAIEVFQRIVDDYPNSKLAERARYEVAYSAYKASLKPEYASEPTEKAIKAFEEFTETNASKDLSQEAAETIRRLKDKGAGKAFNIAKFYEARKKYESAIVYYNEVIEKFPDSSFAKEAKVKIEELKTKGQK